MKTKFVCEWCGMEFVEEGECARHEGDCMTSLERWVVEHPAKADVGDYIRNDFGRVCCVEGVEVRECGGYFQRYYIAGGVGYREGDVEFVMSGDEFAGLVKKHNEVGEIGRASCRERV